MELETGTWRLMAMKYTAILLLAASVAFGQSQPKPAASAAKPASAPAKSASTVKGGATQTMAAKKTASEMPVLHGVVKPLFAERYEEIKVGTGAVAEPNKLYHVLYAGYLATTGQKFDSSSEHPSPVMKDGQPVMGADGKPEMGPPQPLVFPQGAGRLIPGFDQGLTGMRIGGKRRIFIPWQLAYGTRDIPARDGHIGIPPKSDLIFDVELVDVTDMPMQTMGSGMPRPTPPPNPNAHPATPPAETVPGAPPNVKATTPPPVSSAPQSSEPAAPPEPK
jgi:peptidylprolyl isomerase